MHVVRTILIVFCAVAFGVYPAVATTRLMFSSSLRESGRIDGLGDWFGATQRRFDRWAENYQATHYAAAVRSDDVAATEWPLFGSVFFLLSAQELVHSNEVPLSPELRRSLKRAALVIDDPVSATWVRQKWGADYVNKENVFYRMLVMLGLDAYGKITGDRQFAPSVQAQAEGLLRELSAAPHHVLDDYPGECYPSDIVWATAAIARVSELPAADRDRLSREVMQTLAGPLADNHGLPPMQVDARTGSILQPARGCSNSGLLSFAHELSPEIARGWYARYEASYWTASRWLVGFREYAIDSPDARADVDSGPIVFGIGASASLFGIGAARAAGRLDHAAPLTMEVVAAAWPTPWGLLVPGFMGWAATDSWCLGETAFLFAMTRANRHNPTVAFKGRPPLAVAVVASMYWALGAGLFLREALFWHRWRKRNAVRR